MLSQLLDVEMSSGEVPDVSVEPDANCLEEVRSLGVAGNIRNDS